MTVPTDLWHQVRERADFACEYCGITESDAGGELTVDHIRPQAHGGTDEPENLLYCCHRCNLYKADYWPTHSGDQHLWNPRHEAASGHLMQLGDGTPHALTEVGALTLKRLRLNRQPLVAHRVRRQIHEEERRLLGRYRELLALLEQLQRDYSVLLEEHRVLLEEQRTVLRLLLADRE
ncbi:MAG TPA: HNH endonuclease [Planctomycetaceae bacterium]|nr:HNH endonuclease [Planctomycetaceae bacterium]